MNLDDDQKRQVAGWLEQGLKLSEIQRQLEETFGLRPTYMEVKLLVSDLQVLPRDQEPEPAAALSPAAATGPAGAGPCPASADEPAAPEPLPGGGVRVAVDQLARPGAMLSGKVTFANGKTCEWMLDQMGRLGLVPAADGYRPSPVDLQDFQQALEVELQRMGL